METFRIGDIFLLCTFYILVIVTDMEQRVIPFPLTFIGVFFGLYFGFTYHGLVNTCFGGFVGGGIMLIFYGFGILYIRYIHNPNNPSVNEPALGFGDVTLSLILGFILGWPGILGGLFFGIVLGGVMSAILILFKLLLKKYAPNELIVPYAPFLIIGALIIMLL
jgi:leader peptidase (prepilin peptidase)/N-methyltransferase